ncbi:hypothetical protein BDV93DRAFT_507639 [Ceratobasidium sp. AG-I]|nr:hypothetical protein BDV93DRAFT_507639 [Ceratobasidium sp. AG-I]
MFLGIFQGLERSIKRVPFGGDAVERQMYSQSLQVGHLAKPAQILVWAKLVRGMKEWRRPVPITANLKTLLGSRLLTQISHTSEPTYPKGVCLPVIATRRSSNVSPDVFGLLSLVEQIHSLLNQFKRFGKLDYIVSAFTSPNASSDHAPKVYPVRLNI